MPSVVIANPYFPPFVPGGAEHSLIEFCRKMSAEGWRIHVLTMAWDGKPRTDEIDGYRVEWLECPLLLDDVYDPAAETFLTSPEGQAVIVNRVKEIIDAGNSVDWLLANNAQYLGAAASITTDLGIPASVVLRDTQVICETAACLDGRRAEWASPCRGVVGALLCYLRFVREREANIAVRAWPGILLSGFNTWKRREEKRRSLLGLTRIVTISEALASLVKHVPGVDPQCVSVIPNFATQEPPVPTKEVDDYLKECGLSEKRYFLMAGRKSKGKGIDTAVEAASLLASTGTGLNILVVGGGPAQETGNGVVDRPSVSRELLMGLLLKSLALVVPGRRQEGLHRTMLDAVARGVPVICTESGGVPEGVSDGENGYVTRCNDPQAICDAMIRVYSWSEEQKARCISASERIRRKKFSDEVICKRWREFNMQMTKGAVA